MYNIPIGYYLHTIVMFPQIILILDLMINYCIPTIKTIKSTVCLSYRSDIPTITRYSDIL